MTEWKKGTLKTLFTLSLRIQSFLHMGKKTAKDDNNKCTVPPSSNGTKKKCPLVENSRHLYH